MYAHDKGTEAGNKAGRPTNNAVKSNFEKWYKWLDEQTELFTISEFHAKYVDLQKRSKCLLFKIDEKNVSIALLEINFFHRWTRTFERSVFSRYGKYHIARAMVQRWEREF